METKITHIVQDLLSRMGFEVSEIREQELGDRIKVDIILDDARMLIGERGATLAMFQHVVRRLWLRQISRSEIKKLGAPTAAADTTGTIMLHDKNLEFLETHAYSEKTYNVPSTPIVDIDINGYKHMREELLKDFAIDIAETVREKKKTIELDSMSSFDRRVIHLALSSFSDVTTESVGEGEGRYIVVRPYP